MMYPKFIEVHWNTIPLSYNVENITWFGDKFIYIAGQDTSLDVDESYDEIKALIKDSGCLIRKADPRLDMERPLTMDDIKGMVGEPVWNSNTGEWGLITKDAERDGEITEGFLIRYHDGNMTYLHEEGLKKFPIYRMKVVGGR